MTAGADGARGRDGDLEALLQGVRTTNWASRAAEIARLCREARAERERALRAWETEKSVSDSHRRAHDAQKARADAADQALAAARAELERVRAEVRQLLHEWDNYYPQSDRVRERIEVLRKLAQGAEGEGG